MVLMHLPNFSLAFLPAFLAGHAILAMDYDVVVYGNRLDGVMTWAESLEKIHTYGYHALLRQPPAVAGK